MASESETARKCPLARLFWTVYPPDSSTCQRSHFRAVLNTATNSSDLHWLYTRDETFNFIVARYRSFTFENNSYCGYEAKEGAEEEKMDVTGEDGNAFF